MTGRSARLAAGQPRPSGTASAPSGRDVGRPSGSSCTTRPERSAMTDPATAPGSATPATGRPRDTWRLLGADGRFHDSHTPGAWGGHRRNRIYGRLDCPTALRALARGGYRSQRVFFADEPTAVN